ncbi:MAG: AIPR family protein [Streptococcaceae bacterium]|nr:AIPR family protein [Streptococcaceae bacterium]
MKKQIKMQVVLGSFKRIEDPDQKKICKYIFNVMIDKVSPDIPMETNPRNQNIKTNVAKKIRESLQIDDGLFYLKNRGIVLSAGTVRFDNKKNEVTIYFDDFNVHGNIDGGHTYKIIKEYIGLHLKQCVQFEIMTGVDYFIVDLAESRNTSVQVDAKSLAELSKKFEPIKEGIEGLPFYKRIAFKQNQREADSVTGRNLKMLDSREIVALISMFDINTYTSSNHPRVAYTGKEASLKKYLKDPNYYRKFINIMPDIFDLYEDIETQFKDAYNETGGRYASKRFSGYKEGDVVTQSKFGGKDMIVKVHDPFIYPILAAFRSLIVEDVNGNFKFKKSPKKVWEIMKSGLVRSVMDQTRALGETPNTLGKDPNIWNLLYVLIAFEGSK